MQKYVNYSRKINLLRQSSEEEGTQLARPLQLKIRGILIYCVVKHACQDVSWDEAVLN